jgi:hypothetical protein
VTASSAVVDMGGEWLIVLPLRGRLNRWLKFLPRLDINRQIRSNTSILAIAGGPCRHCQRPSMLPASGTLDIPVSCKCASTREAVSVIFIPTGE